MRWRWTIGCFDYSESGLQGEQYAIILTNATGQIIHSQSEYTIDLEQQSLAAIALWRIAFDSNTTISVGMSITNLMGCYDLSNVINIGTDQAGCDDASACNYDPSAECNDGSCDYGTEYFADTDNDGFGDINNSIFDCNGAPTNYVLNSDDCNDGNENVYPGAEGTGEGIDNNCDDEITGAELIPSSCIGDMDGNLVINTADLLELVSSLGCTSNCGNKDMNGDMVVNTSDLIELVSLLGTVCD